MNEKEAFKTECQEKVLCHMNDTMILKTSHDTTRYHQLRSQECYLITWRHLRGLCKWPEEWMSMDPMASIWAPRTIRDANRLTPGSQTSHMKHMSTRKCLQGILTIPWITDFEADDASLELTSFATLSAIDLHIMRFICFT